jgi:hypothetical protein
MDFLPDGTLYLEDPAALKIPETSAGSGATATLQGQGSGRRLPTLDTSSGFIDDGTLRVADPDALAVPDPNNWRAADPITPVKPISGSGSNWEWDWETGLVRETWMSTIQQDQHAWEKVGRSWDWLAGCCEECETSHSLHDLRTTAANLTANWPLLSQEKEMVRPPFGLGTSLYSFSAGYIQWLSEPVGPHDDSSEATFDFTHLGRTWSLQPCCKPKCIELCKRMVARAHEMVLIAQGGGRGLETASSRYKLAGAALSVCCDGENVARQVHSNGTCLDTCLSDADCDPCTVIAFGVGSPTLKLALTGDPSTALNPAETGELLGALKDLESAASALALTTSFAPQRGIKKLIEEASKLVGNATATLGENSGVVGAINSLWEGIQRLNYLPFIKLRCGECAAGRPCQSKEGAPLREMSCSHREYWQPLLPPRRLTAAQLTQTMWAINVHNHEHFAKFIATSIKEALVDAERTRIAS